jgi:N-acetylglutamate synthase-like GNAT family acetyltransferase
MNSVVIRKAKEEDVPLLLPLLEQLGYPHVLKDLQKRFELFAAQEGYGVAVAEQEGKIIGWVAWSRSFAFVVPKVRFHIEGLVVDISYRTQGVGKQLMTYVEDVAKQHRPCIIDLTSGKRRAKDGSHEFYKALGYQNEGYMAKAYLRKEI